MSSDLALLLAGGFAAAFASGLAGFAFALVASGVWYQLLTPAEAAPLIVAGSLLIQSGTLLTLRRIIAWARLWPFLAGGLLGTPLGVLVLAWADAGAIRTAVGALLVAYSAWMLALAALRLSPPRLVGGRAGDAAVGFGGGLLGGIGGFSGVLPAIWADLRGWRKDEARGIYQPYILAMQLASLLGLAAGGFITARTGELLLWCLPALALGGWLGMRLYRATTAARFRLILLGLLLVSGLGLLV